MHAEPILKVRSAKHSNITACFAEAKAPLYNIYMRPLFQQQIARRILQMMSYLANKADHDQPFTSISFLIAAAHACFRLLSAVCAAQY